jgi:hypothetical protein
MRTQTPKEGDEHGALARHSPWSSETAVRLQFRDPDPGGLARGRGG